MITIFSNPRAAKNKETESRKVSYWLEKLFKQEKKTKEESEGKGQEEAIKNHYRKIETDHNRLDDMMSKSNRMILSIRSMFPWDIFQSSVNVEETRVNVIHRQFFASQVHSVDIEDISNVFIDTFLFFTTLTIVSNTFEENNIKVMKLRKKEADLARRLIEGLRMFKEKDIDTSKYSAKELIDELENLSTTKTMF